MKKKFSFHFGPLLNNPFIKKAKSCCLSRTIRDRLKMTLVWIAVLFCAAYMMKSEASERSFQLNDNVVTQNKRL